MGTATIAGEVAKEYCRKWPNTPDLTLAKKLYKEQPKLFKTVEQCRTLIRYTRGHFGKRNREKIDRTLMKEITGDTNPFRLPESKTVEAEVFHLPTSIKKILFLSDTHFPYHCVEAIQAAIQYGINEGVDCVWCNGDIMDFYQVSFHEKDPRKTSIPEELEMGRGFLATLREAFPLATIYFVPGNHENRLERYLRVKAPELLDMEEFKLDVLLKVREHDVVFIPYGSKVYFGKLLVEHGDKMRGSGGVSPARTLALKFKRHVICGHFHRTNEYLSKVYDGDIFATYSVGALCELEPSFLPVNDHNHGCAIIEMLEGGEFIVHNKKIVKGKVY